MIRSRHNYDEIYRDLIWAYGDKPDPELIAALTDVVRGRAVDIGGGQGRNALALAALGFDVAVIDSSSNGLHQAAAEAEQRSLPLHVVQSDLAHYEPEPGLKAVVGALFFHIPATKTSLKVAECLGEALDPGGVFYVSLPGFTKETVAFVEQLMETAGCKKDWVVKHLVTKKDRPRLPVARRNETRALGIKP
ncbi:MAG: methyltransferase domain-containing protein [Actinomycetota bacterium]